jgi:hypothetical protein
MLCRTVAAIANDPDFHLNLKLQPGDIEIIHNPSTFHSRTKVGDGEVSHCFNTFYAAQRWLLAKPPEPRCIIMCCCATCASCRLGCNCTGRSSLLELGSTALVSLCFPDFTASFAADCMDTAFFTST